MAISILNTGSATGTSNDGSLTISSFNGGATTRSVIVLFAQDVKQPGTPVSTTSATFAGESMTKLAEIGVVDDQWVAVWGINNPSSTTGDVVVNYSDTDIQTIILCASSDGYIHHAFLHVEDVIEYGNLSFPPNSLGVCGIGSRSAGVLTPTNATKVVESNQSSSYASLATVDTLSTKTNVNWNTTGSNGVAFILLSSLDPKLIGFNPKGDIISHDIITN